ncbi:MAG: hypothetical protein PHW52_04665 [Candidatus Pacebacteria bacterium]|nr:hypothetical protein [Candidatus Paceibacterota bacterium]
MGYFPIEKPGKSISFNSMSSSSNQGDKNSNKDKKKGWSSTPSKPDEGNKYASSLSGIKGKVMGVDNNKQSGVIKPWSFSSSKVDSRSPELGRYGDSLSRLKGGINKKKN